MTGPLDDEKINVNPCKSNKSDDNPNYCRHQADVFQLKIILHYYGILNAVQFL